MRLRFVAGHDFTSELIRRGERDGIWTHVEAVLPDGGYLGAHFAGGVQVRQPGYDKDSLLKDKFIDLPATKIQDDAFYAFLHSQLGKPYDWQAVLGYGLGRDWRQSDRWYCSELQAAACEGANWFEFPLGSEVYHISPRDFYLVLSVKVQV